MIERGRTYAYPLPGYWRDLGRPETYLAAHRELLAGEVSLFAPDWPITTTVEKRAPARLHRGCSVADSMIADGCEIFGSVRNSVLGPGVVVEAGAQVRDSVIFADVTVRSAATVDWSIVDRGHRDRHRCQGRDRQPAGGPRARAPRAARGRLPHRPRRPRAPRLPTGTGHDRRGGDLGRDHVGRMPENAAMTGSPAQPPRPLIGITTYREQARFGAWNSSADLLHATYARSVEAAGGVAVLLPPQNLGAVEVVSRLDAVIIAGGADVDPARYGASPHARTQTWRPDRDAWEWALLDAADAAGRPVLGICRGMQLMAVRAGGSLEQHLPDVVGHSEHSPAPGAFGWTPIRTEPGSLVRRLVGEETQVNCAHHQAVARHPAFEVTARATDGTIEAIEDPERPFWLAVQWHPEYGDDYGLFRGLVAAAAGAPTCRRAGRAAVRPGSGPDPRRRTCAPGRVRSARSRTAP